MIDPMHESPGLRHRDLRFEFELKETVPGVTADGDRADSFVYEVHLLAGLQRREDPHPRARLRFKEDDLAPGYELHFAREIWQQLATQVEVPDEDQLSIGDRLLAWCGDDGDGKTAARIHQRLVLCLDGVHPLERLPWEALGTRGNDSEGYTRNIQPTLTRAWEVLRYRRVAEPTDRPLVPRRVLVLIGSQDTEVHQHHLAIDAIDAVQAIFAACEELGLECKILVSQSEHDRLQKAESTQPWLAHAEPLVTIEALRDELQSDGGPELIHFFGHSDAEPPTHENPEGRGATKLMLELPANQPERRDLNLDDLRDCLEDSHTRVIVLNACRTDEDVGPALLASVDWVVGVRAFAGSKLAKVWSAEFYEQLVDSKSIGYAAWRARAALHRAGDDLWWAPALWSRTLATTPFADPDTMAIDNYLQEVEVREREFEGDFAQYEMAMDKVSISLSVLAGAGKDATTANPAEIRTRRGRSGGPDDAELMAEVWEQRHASDTPNLSYLLAHKHKCWVVRGAPGSGKTTTLRQLTRKLCADEGRSHIPLFVSLTRWAKEGRPRTIDGLLDYIGARYQPKDHAKFVAAVTSRIKAEAVAFLLDSLDELADEALDEAVDLFQTLARTGCPAVVSTRPVGFVPFATSLFRGAELLPLTPTQKEELLFNWYCLTLERSEAKQRARTDAVDLAHGSYSLQMLSQIPLFLNLIARRLVRDPGKPKELRHAFLEEMVGFLLAGKHRPKSRTALPIEQRQPARVMLRALALRMTGEGIVKLPKGKLIDQLEKDGRCDDKFGGGEACLQTIMTRTSLVQPVARDEPEGEFKFFHRAFQEALCAEALLDLAPGQDVEPLIERAKQVAAAAAAGSDNEQSQKALRFWTEPFSLLTGYLGDKRAERWIEALLAQPELHSIARAAVATADSLSIDVLRQVIETCETWEDRAELWQLLGGRLGRGPEALDLLVDRVTPAIDRSELYFIDEALLGIAANHPALKDEVAKKRAEVFDKVVVATDGPALGETLRAAFRSVPGRADLPLFAEIPPGYFIMGSDPESQWHGSNEGPVPVHISKGYCMARVPVTEAQFALFVSPGDKTPRSNLPVSEINWYVATIYCRWLSHHTGWQVSLPTEAQWEYAANGRSYPTLKAARAAGPGPAFFCGDNRTDLDGVGWHSGNSGHSRHEVARPPGGEGAPIHPHRIYDMHGNVWEWCEDWYGDYEAVMDDAALRNPRGPSGGAQRVLRGGSYWNDAHYCRSAYRNFWHPAVDFVLGSYGFRVVLAAAAAPELK